MDFRILIWDKSVFVEFKNLMFHGRAKEKGQEKRRRRKWANSSK